MSVPRVTIEFTRVPVADVVASGTGLVNGLGEDVTAQMVRACTALCDRLCDLGVREAWLKEGSPSCGVHRITVGGARTAGEGIQTALLRQAGVRVRSEEDLPDLAPAPSEPASQGGGA